MKSCVSGKGLLCVFAMALAWNCTDGKSAQGQEPPAGEAQKYPLKIASQPLGDALQEFSRQSGIQVIYFSRLTDGLRAPALEGMYTLREALRALLLYSNLTFKSINANTIHIEQATHASAENPQGAAAPPPARARDTGNATSSSVTEELVIRGTAEGLVATRTETPLRDIPQTISIISREQIRQQNDTDLAEALENAAGITAVRSDSMDERFYSRGYQITSFHIDGGAAMTSMINSLALFLGTPDLNEYDHIEVLRGADALFSGLGNPGGTINLIRKHPLGTADFTFSGSAGSWGNERAELDLTGPLGFGGALRGRLDGVYQDRNYFYDTASLRRRKLFAALEIDVTPRTLLTLGGSYQSDDAVPVFAGVPLYNDGSDPHLPRNTSLGFDWAFYRTRLREFYMQLRHEFAPGWKVKANAAAWNESVDYGFAAFTVPVDPLTHGIPQIPAASFTSRPNTEQQLGFDITFTGTFDWFGRHEEAAFGGDFTRLVDSLLFDEFDHVGPPLANVFAYNSALYADPRSGGSLTQNARFSSTYRQLGAFASLRLYLDDHWSIVGGGRISSNRTFSRVGVFAPVLGLHVSASAEVGDSAMVTPYAGVTYHVDDHYSVYASYADIYTTMGIAQRSDGKLIGTARGTDLEVGTKGVWRDGAVNGSVVLYDVAQRNVPIRDLTAVGPGSIYCCFFTGTNRSRGVDVELGGQLTPGWLLAAGYTFNANHAAAGGALSSITPRHLLKLWTSKSLPGYLYRWSVGGSLRVQSSQWQEFPCPVTLSACPAGSLPVRSVQGTYAVADLRASYQIHPRWQAALTVSNVFDRIYYQTLGSSLANNWYGQPRAVMVRVDARY
jgi:outer-membrane receptor for ferric coprogen and ferric-rhodotorulic acid